MEEKTTAVLEKMRGDLRELGFVDVQQVVNPDDYPDMWAAIKEANESLAPEGTYLEAWAHTAEHRIVLILEQNGQVFFFEPKTGNRFRVEE